MFSLVSSAFSTALEATVVALVRGATSRAVLRHCLRVAATQTSSLEAEFLLYLSWSTWYEESRLLVPSPNGWLSTVCTQGDVR